MAEIVPIIPGLLDAFVKIKQYVFDPIKTQFSYVRRYSDIMERLGRKIQELKFTRGSLQQQIQAAKDNLHNINPNVENWCGRVDQRIEEIDRFLADEPRDQNGSCLQGTCTGLKLRYSRGRKATKLSEHIVGLLDEYRTFDGSISYPAPPTGMETIPVTSDILEFDSRKRIEEEIMSYLKVPSIYLIGVWGMGGVGKTIMAEKIGRRAFEEKQFDKIVKAVVSQQVDLFEIQEQLAEGLRLHLTEKAVPTRATKLHARLMNERILIFLDDLWNPLKLEQLGIPSKTKVLFTTRDNHVCRSMFREEAARMVELKFLKEEEAFSLFCENVGRVVEQANLRPLAMDVARECKGLPLALVIVGRAMRQKEDEWFWKDSLRQLQTSAATDVRGYRDDVYGPLKLSYDNLENLEDKYLFLLCCLFHEDSVIAIENLVRYGVGLPCFFSPKESISEARRRVYSKVENLVDRCLLMDAGYARVKMHDVIRDMAISIAAGGEFEHKFMVRHDKGVREWPHESYTCISLTLGEAMTFQEGMHCPGLKAFFLTFDRSISTPMLPKNFLNGMADLTLLHINWQRWFSGRVFGLPLSFLSSLTKLRVLHLDHCDLEDISLLGQLKDLEILSCRGSDIQLLPVEIRDLTKLKLMDMTDCRKLKNIASGVLSALVQLEELHLMECPIEWERGETGDERRNASLAEVFSLENLRFLEIWIRDLGVISQKMDYVLKLPSYSIAIGPESGAFGLERSYMDLKRMSVCVDERRGFTVAISKLIEDVKGLKLKGRGCKGIIELLGREGFKNINSLKIDELGDVKILVQPNMHGVIFPILRNLQLSNMNDLEKICNGHPQVGSFSSLEKIAIQNCAKLKWVFPLSMAESLSKLQSMVVSDCPVVEEVFKKSERVSTSVNHVKFPNLKEMHLNNLPMLGARCKAVDAIIEFPESSLTITGVSPNFKVFGNLPLDQLTCTKLKEFTMDNLGMEIFYREVPNGFFSGIEVLSIMSFHRLKVLFSLAIFRGLINLTTLNVVDCKMLEDIVKMENEDAENTNLANEKIIIHKLRDLYLSNLPKICYFWRFSCALEFPSLETVRITDCPMMESLAVDPSCCNSNMPSGSFPKFFFGQQVICPKLRELRLVNLKISGMLLSAKTPIAFLETLYELNIEMCHNLKSLFTLRMFKGLISLGWVDIQNCSLFEEVIAKDEDEDVDVDDDEMVISLPELNGLVLRELPKLRCFSHTHCDLDLPSLNVIHLSGCTEIMKSSFCLGGGSVRIPTGGVVYGISDPEFASQFFFPTQHPQEEDNLDEGCFMLLPSDLSFTAIYPSVVKGPSNAFFLGGWKKACGKFDMEKLSPEIIYEIAFVIMLFLDNDDKFETMLADEKREHEMKVMPRKQWMEILVGELRLSSGQCGDIIFSLEHRHYYIPVALKCAIIRPKKLRRMSSEMIG